MNESNILVFFCDQLRLDYLGCYGGNLARTPNINALADASVVFDRAYTPIALCSPARASLMTGLYPHAHHMFNNSTPGYSYCHHLRPDLAILPDWIADNTTYESAYFGKWHIGPNADLYHSRFDHTGDRYEDSPPHMGSHPNSRLGPIVRAVAGGKGGTLDIPMESFPDCATADATRRFLRERDGNRPFIAFCAFPGPHSPWFVPEAFGIRHKADAIELRPNRHDPLEGKPLNQRKLAALPRHPDAVGHMPGGDDDLRELLACCLSYMELIDEQVGGVVDDLKRLGLYENTTIVFTADHGDMAGAHGFLSKGAYMYDETYRIPLLIKPAGASRPRRLSSLVNLTDVTATLMHVMAGKAPSSMGEHDLQGRSLLGLVDGDSEWDRPVHFGEYHGDWYGHYSARMVTDGEWKLVWNLSDLGEMYDLRNDPYELNNLFYDVSCRETRDRYFALLVEEARKLGDGQLRLLLPAVEDMVLSAEELRSISARE